MARQHSLGIFTLAGLILGFVGCRSKPLTSFNDGIDKFVGCLELINSFSSGPVLARIGNDTITLSDFQAYLDRLPVPARKYYTTADSQRQLLNSLIDQKVLAVSARQLGLDRDEKYRRTLAELEDNLLRQSLMDHLGPITDMDIQTYYDQHKTEYTSRIQFKTSHLVVTSLSDAKSAQNLLRSGQSLTATAKEISRTTTVANLEEGLKLTTGSMDLSLERELTKLGIGQVTAFHKSRVGYELWRKDGEVHLPAVPFETAERQIRNTLEFAKLDAVIQKTRPSLNVTINERVLASLATSSNNSH
jgi:hypothetical protein